MSVTETIELLRSFTTKVKASRDMIEFYKTCNRALSECDNQTDWETILEESYIIEEECIKHIAHVTHRKIRNVEISVSQYINNHLWSDEEWQK